MFGDLTQNTSTANLARGSQWMNMEHRYLLQKYFNNEATYTITTKAQQQFYKLPPDYSKLKTGTLTIGSLKWTPTEIMNRADWDKLNVFPYYADIPNNFFIWQMQFGLWPIPATGSTLLTYTGLVGILANGDIITIGSATGKIIAYTSTTMTVSVTSNVVFGTGAFTTSGSASGTVTAQAVTAGNTITFNYKKRVPDLSIADYSTGTASVTNGGYTVTGGATTWTVTQNAITESRWIQFTGGDNLWYQIASVDAVGSLTLYQPYQGVTIVGGTYTIGQMPLLQEDFQDMPLWKALTIYFTSIVDNPKKRAEYEQLYQQRLLALEEYCGTKTLNVNLSPQPTMRNPNLYWQI